MNKFFIIIILIILSTKLFANPNIQARTGILIDHHSNEILYELEPDAKIYPASMTKIMTAIVAFDLLKKNKISLDDKFTISENAWRLSQAGYSSMFIMINDQVSVENLLRGIIIASGNDACVALAEGIAGSEANFADMMNEKAGEIGMTSTNFTNSSGITVHNCGEVPLFPYESCCLGSINLANFVTKDKEFDKDRFTEMVRIGTKFLMAMNKIGEFPIAEAYYRDAISIPLFHVMTNEQQDEVVKVLSKVLEKA